MGRKSSKSGTPKATRLAPRKDVLRELYLKSGNQCAFPGCTEVIMDNDGAFVGQLCHIEAAEEGGERFNKNMTDELRRAFENLMLMCYPHHVKTNDVATYTVPVLQNMKADHEAKFTDVAAKIQNAITDKAAATKRHVATTIKAFVPDLTDDERKITLKDVEWAAERLHKLPLRTRQLLTITINRLGRRDIPKSLGQKFRYEHSVVADEVAEACDLPPAEVQKHSQILEKYGVGYLGVYDGDLDPPRIYLNDTPSGWFIWGDFREFCQTMHIPLAALIEELHFDLLD